MDPRQGLAHRRRRCGGRAIRDRAQLTDETVIVRLAHFACEMGVSFLCTITDEFFPSRIPLEFPSLKHRDNDQVADDRGTMTFFHPGDGILPGVYAVHEVAHVIAADFELELIVGQWRL